MAERRFDCPVVALDSWTSLDLLRRPTHRSVHLVTEKERNDSCMEVVKTFGSEDRSCRPVLIQRHSLDGKI